MSSPPRVVPTLLAALVILSAGFAGCVTPGSLNASTVNAEAVQLNAAAVQDGLLNLASLRAEPVLLDVDVTINVVLVGIDPERVDVDAIEAALPTDYSPEMEFSEVRGADLRSGLRHNLDYAFHFAPEAFADELFANYAAWSREAEIPGSGSATPGFLERYDAMYDLGRAEGGSMRIVDAEKVETWIHEHRDEHGLSFDNPQYTVFFLDTWTNHRVFEDTYYWYEFANDTRAGSDTRNLRAWGGTYDFLFLDYAAAPNDSMNDNVGLTKQDVCCGVSVPAKAPEGTAYNDPPAWHYDGTGTATIGQGAFRKTVDLSDRIRHAVDVAVNIRLLGDYANKPVYKENYFVNVHLWHDGHSIMPHDDLDNLLDEERLFRGLQEQIPWANVTGSISTYHAPTDDPGMYEALNKAKAEAAGSYIPIQPIYQYVDAHKEKYRQNDPGVFDVMALLFLVEGHYTFFLPLIVGGVAFGGPDGTAWGTISSRNDLSYLGSGQDMERMGEGLLLINAHEIGHFFGLTHAHDGSRRTADGYESFLDHTWSSTNTVMSYRMRPESTDTFHVDILARGHALQNLELALRNTHSTYRALEAQGADRTPGAIADLLEAATRDYNAAVASFEQGAYVDAVHAAIAARRATDRAVELAGVVERDVVVESWSASGVHSTGHKHSAMFVRPGVSPTGAKFDYRPVQLTPDVERVTVRATWTNTPDSWGDFFIGWTLDPRQPVLSTGPVALGTNVEFGGGVHDNGEEGPLAGEVEQWFTLDMDTFTRFREDALTLYLGAGTQGMAVNGAYDVEIVVTYRDHGDGSVPEDAAPEDVGAGALRELPVRVPDAGPLNAHGETAAGEWVTVQAAQPTQAPPAERATLDAIRVG